MLTRPLHSLATLRASSLLSTCTLPLSAHGLNSMEGSVYPKYDVLGIVLAELEPHVIGELKGPFIHRRH